MHKLLSYIAVTAIALTSCNSKSAGSSIDDMPDNDSTELVMPVEVPATPGMARKLIEENTFIDIDYPSLVNRINEAQFDSTKITPSLSDDVARGKAAIYRMASHTKVVDNLMVYDGTPAKELNIADGILKEYLKSIDDNNTVFRKWKNDSLDYEVPPIDEEYLKSLLK